MRKKVLASLAGLFASAGGALAQMPAGSPAMTAPRPLAPAGAYDGAIQPAQGIFRPTDPIPPVLPGPGPEAPLDPGFPGADPMGGMGMPGYPPPGPYGQQLYSTPRLEGLGLFNPRRIAPRVWVHSDLLLMAVPNQMTQPLITSGAPADAGILGQGTTSTLYGGELSYGIAPGFRIMGGFFRPEDQRLGAEFGGFYLAPRSNNFFGLSGQNGLPVIARPFFAIDLNAASSLLVSFPTFASGSILGRTTSDLWGAEGSGILNLYRTPADCLRGWTLNVTGGFKFLELEERIYLASATTVLPGVTIPFSGLTVTSPSNIHVFDDFRAQNKFYGGQVGVQSHFFSGRWYAGFNGKVAAGWMHQRFVIDGSSTLYNQSTGVNGQAVGGVYATNANIGTYRSDDFALVTDLNASLGFNVTSWFTIAAGYNLINISNGVRPGPNLSTRVDSTRIPGSINYGNVGVPITPITLQSSDYLTHGVNFSFLFRY